MAAERFVHTYRVTYSDCTVGNHIYYGRYLELLERARGEFFHGLGLSFHALQEQGFIFPVIEARLRYKSQARYDDILKIEVWPTCIERVRLNFGHRVICGGGTLVLEAETFHVCTGTNDRPKRLPEELAVKLQPLLENETA